MEVKYEQSFLFTGFTAIGMTNHTNNILEFSNVLTNIGGSFNYDSGVFLCPYNAYYYFEFKVTVQGGKCSLMKDTIELISIDAGESQGFLQYTNSIVTLCKAGQHVFVQGQGPLHYQGSHSSFSGYVVASA